MFFKKGVLKNFAIFTKKTPALESLFSKVAGLRPAALLKKDSNTGFLVNISKFLTAAFFKEHLRWLLL